MTVDDVRSGLEVGRGYVHHKTVSQRNSSNPGGSRHAAQDVGQETVLTEVRKAQDEAHMNSF